MLQRVQTAWLLVAAIFAFLSLRFPIYTGTKVVDNVTQAGSLDGGSNFLLLILSVSVGLLALITIFLYKNRKLQFRLCLIALLVEIGCLAFYFYLAESFTTGVLALTSLFSFTIPIFLILAARGIYRDERLVKSINRLR